MSVSEVRIAHSIYCDKNNLFKAEYSGLKAQAGELIYERFQLRIRHDIKTDAGTSAPFLARRSLAGFGHRANPSQ